MSNNSVIEPQDSNWRKSEAISPQYNTKLSFKFYICLSLSSSEVSEKSKK